MILAWAILKDLLAVVFTAAGAIAFIEGMAPADEAARRARRRAVNDDPQPFGDIVEVHPEARASHASRLREKEQQDRA